MQANSQSVQAAQQRLIVIMHPQAYFHHNPSTTPAPHTHLLTCLPNLCIACCSCASLPPSTAVHSTSLLPIIIIGLFAAPWLVEFH